MTDTLIEPVEEKPKQTGKFPEELSSMLVQVLGDAQTICINAGDGSLLQQFSSKNRHGIDQDETLYNKSKSKYEPCIGTYPRLAEMFGQIEAQFGRTNFIIDLTVNVSDTIMLTHNMSAGNGRQGIAILHDPQSTPPLITFDGHQEPVVVGRINIIDLNLSVTFQTFQPRADIGAHKSMDVNHSMLNLVPIWVAEQARERAYRGMEAGSSYITISDTLKMVHREYGAVYIKKEKPAPSVELYGGNMMQVTLSPFRKKVLEIKGYLRHVEQVDQKSTDFFKLHPGAWTALADLSADGTITIDPRVRAIAEVAVEDAFRVTTPISPLPVGMRLGWLTDSPRIECILDDEERGFVAGKFYPLTANKFYTPKEFDVEEEDKKTGHMVTKTKKRNQTWTVFTIRSESGQKSIDDRAGEDIMYLAEHFVVRDPGSMATRYPELVEPEVERIQRLEAKYLEPRGYALKTFQIGELAAIQAKGNAILAHEPGMGKTLEGLTYVLAQWDKGCQKSALIIVPADLKRQWAREAHRFYGGTIKELVHKPKKNIGKAERVEHYRAELARVRRLAKAIKRGEQSGIWIVSFRDLAQFTSHLNVKEKPFVVKKTKEDDEWVPGHWLDTTDPETGAPKRVYIDGFYKQKTVEHMSTSCCPRCHGAWDGNYCNRKKIQAGASYAIPENRPKWHNTRGECGYSVFDTKVKTISSIISTAFSAGVVIVDEGTSIANESQQTDSVSAIRGSARLLMSGTPIKNRIGQAFNLLRWCLGPKSERFPYRYNQKTDFTGTYGVFESTMSSEGKWGPPKPVGDTTNRTEMWKQLACAISRLTKDESGVRIPPKKQHVIENPLGVKQREQLDSWRRNFPAWYAETHPDDPKVLSGYYLQNFLRLGIEAKFNWACVLPTGDRAHEWTNVHPSDFTPMALKTLETVMNLVASKRKVILGSDTPLAVEWLSARLREKGIVVACTCKDGASIGQDERVLEIEKFQEGKADVLAASIRSINLGHNIDKATAVVLHGLDWDYATNVQFQDRANRLSSVAPCDIFAILPGKQNGSIIGRKWATLQDKGKGISVALQGSADEIDQSDVNKEAILREMIDKGFPVQGDEVDETDIRNQWDRMPNVFVHKVPEDFTAKLCTWDEEAEPELVPKMYLTPMITVGQVAAAVDAFFRGYRFKQIRQEQEQQEAEQEREREWAEYEAQMQGLRMTVGARLRRLGDWMHEQNKPVVEEVEEQEAPAENDMVAYLREQNAKLSAQIDALTAQVAALIAALGEKGTG